MKREIFRLLLSVICLLSVTGIMVADGLQLWPEPVSTDFVHYVLYWAFGMVTILMILQIADSIRDIKKGKNLH